jgi:(2R)-ethylmalonyl-CoA mutase
MMKRLRLAQLDNIPVVVGGIIPQEDMIRLTEMGVAKIYTPKDFELNTIMMDIVSLADPTDLAAE